MAEEILLLLRKKQFKAIKVAKHKKNSIINTHFNVLIGKKVLLFFSCNDEENK